VLPFLTWLPQICFLVLSGKIQVMSASARIRDQARGALLEA